MRQLVVSIQAEEDLRGIWLYTFEKWGDAQADRYLDELGEGMQRCCENPGHGKNREAVRAGYCSQFVRKHVVFYTFTEKEVVVQRVLHGAMDPSLHMS